MPLRLGFSWSGMDRTELGMGIGFHGGPVMVDLGFSFKSGMWVHSMKGFNVSLGFTMTDLRVGGIRKWILKMVHHPSLKI